MNKNAAEMAISTIIVIILALVVLVVLIYGFTTGWGNLWDRLLGYGGGKVNVQSVVDSCKISCTTTGEYDYCYKKRDVVFKSGDKAVPTTCCELARNPSNGLTCDMLSCCVANTPQPNNLSVSPPVNPPAAPN